ncbi:MAG: DUF1934 family protein [Firmicutes bacterium]|nr:DUF1934 family protein [Bacillota bacterium]
MIPIKIILSTDGENHFYKGILKENINNFIIQYFDENQDTVNICISDMDVEIKRTNSIMKFNKEINCDFVYETEFGNLLFKLVTNSMIIEEKYFIIEYSLYDEFDKLAHKNKLKLEYIKE